jgi:hypothetical protein
MPIPETQLETWSRQGSVTQSAATYEAIKRVLEADTTNYHSRYFKVFLQGSYGNDTNILAESDVDVVIRYDGAFFHDLSGLPPDQQTAFAAQFPAGDYPYDSFKADVQTALQAAFGGAVQAGTKAIKLAATGSRRSADVVVAFGFRRYHRFNGTTDENFTPGICFFRTDGTRIVNYPRQHSDNCTTKHQATSGNFKPLVRVLKNIRSRLEADGVLAEGVAPSYFVEGLLYNVPNELFSGSYEDMVVASVNWLNQQTNRADWVCANEQYYLLRDDPVCWLETSYQQFIAAVINLWNGWT